jgi:uncharacterized protein (DUF2336 family)
MLEASNQYGIGMARPKRRVTAESFRVLQARLAGVPYVPPPEPATPDVVPAAPAPDVEIASEFIPNGTAPAVTAPQLQEAWQPDTFEAPVEPPAALIRPDAQPYTAEPEQFEEIVEPPAPVYEQPQHVEPAAFDQEVPYQPVAAAPEINEIVEPQFEEPVQVDPQPAITTPIPDLAPVETVTTAWAAPAPRQEPNFSFPELRPPLWPTDGDTISAAEPQTAEPAQELSEIELAKQAYAEAEVEMAPAVAVAEPEPLLETPAPAIEPPLEAAEQFAMPPAKPREALLLRRNAPAVDPFADAVDFTKAEEPEPIKVVVEDPDAQAGEVARSLIDIMASSAGSSQPQERALASDTLLQLIPRVPVKELVQIAERVAKMDNPPQLLISRIIRDPRPEVAATLLERAGNIADQELLTIAAEAEPLKLRMMARRRTVSTALSDAIVKAGDASALLTLVRNPGASLSHDAFQKLCEIAREMPALHAPLATRADTPPVVAFQMFWLLPAELRRYILSRFLTDSETLNRILKITMAVDGGDDPADAGEAKFPPADDVDTFLALAAKGEMDAAARRLAEVAGICEETGRRILSDAEGEPLAVLLKSLGLSRTRFAEAIERLSQPPASLLRAERNLNDLQGIFDQLSFNKARVLLTYWDWAAQQTGPYAKRAA